LEHGGRDLTEAGLNEAVGDNYGDSGRGSFATDVGPGLARASGRLFVSAVGWGSQPAGSNCVHLQDVNRRHSRSWRLIGSAALMAALLSAAVGPSTTIAGGVSGAIMTCRSGTVEG